MDGDGDGDGDDDDPDEVQLDDGDNGDVFLPPGRNFPGRFLPAGELFSLLFSVPQRRRKIPSMVLWVLGFRGEEVHRRGLPDVGQGLHTTPRRGQRWAHA